MKQCCQSRSLRGLEYSRGIATLLAISCLASVSFLATDVKGKETNTVVATEFIKEAKLTPEQVERVVRLAKRCGIKEPALVRTFQPMTMGIGIQVESAERIKGRERDQDFLEVYSVTSGGGREPDSKALREGEFWADPKPRTVHKVSFNSNQKSFLLRLGRNIPIATADSIMKAVVEGKVDYKAVSQIFRVLTLDVAKISSLDFDPESKHYKFNHRPQTWVVFDLVEEKIKVISFTEYRF